LKETCETISCDPLSLSRPHQKIIHCGIGLQRPLGTIYTLFIGFSSNTSHCISQVSEFKYFFHIQLVLCTICCVEQQNTMGFRIAGIIRRASFSTTQAASKRVEVPKGYLAVYVGDKMRRFMIPVSYLNQPSFQELLNQAEEEFGYDHPTGGLTIPCQEDEFLNVTSRLNEL